VDRKVLAIGKLRKE